MAVILPTGNSELMARVLANVSAINKNKAPIKMENINKIRLLFPQIIRTIWGTISPMKPITPQIDTTAAINNEEINRDMMVIFFELTPSVFAVSPPNCIIFRSFE